MRAETALPAVARPIRVLHVLGGLDRGGAETWLVQLLGAIDRQRIAVDVMVNDGSKLTYAALVSNLGCQVLVCGRPDRPAAWARTFLRLVRAHGPYDVVHVHLQLFSGLVVRLARHAGVPMRIAHSRNSEDGRRVTPSRLGYRLLMRYWLTRHTTQRLAVSPAAARGTFGRRRAGEHHCKLLTGVDFTPFLAPVDRRAVRGRMAISDERRVVGHVGSFRPQKNQQFLVRVACDLSRARPDVLFLLAGDGPLRPAIEERVRALGLAERFRFLGESPDVPRLMMGAMDAFVLPSLYEGLPRVLLEAQAAGLQCVASSAVSAEAAAVPGSVRFVPLEIGSAGWAAELTRALEIRPSPARGRRAIAAFAARGMTVAANASELTRLYEASTARCV